MSSYIFPVASLKGNIRLPASKSYSIRAFFIASCGGTSTIHFPSDCDDALVAMKIVKNFGIDIKINGDTFSLTSNLKHVRCNTFDVGESGTSLRFLLPLLPLVTTSAQVMGHGTLIGRPNVHLCSALRDAGLKMNGATEQESVPIVFSGGSLRPGNIIINGSVSSQFISALLIALPQLKEDTTLEVKGTMVSKDYIVMTRQILEEAGIVIKEITPRKFFVKGNQIFKGLSNFTIPSDYGLAAFPLAAAALIPSHIQLLGFFNDHFIQADGHILSFLKRMGVAFTKGSKAISIQGPFQLKGGNFNLSNCPDLVPIMAVLAMFAKGPTKLTGIAHARLKESDRINDVSDELSKVGAKFKISDDSMTILPQKKYTTGVLLNSHRDHRLAMAFTILGSKIGCRINDLTCTHKSYPRFIEDMKQLGLLFK